MTENLFDRTVKLWNMDEDAIKEAWDKIRLLNMNPDEPEVIQVINNVRLDWLQKKERIEREEFKTEMKELVRNLIEQASNSNKENQESFRSDVKKIVSVFQDNSGKIIDTLNNNGMQIVESLNVASEDNNKKIASGVARHIGPRIDDFFAKKIKLKDKAQTASFIGMGAVIGLVLVLIGFIAGNVHVTSSDNGLTDFLKTLSPYVVFSAGFASVFCLFFVVNTLRNWKTSRDFLKLKEPGSE